MKALVLTSGGVDSATCLALAVEKYGAEQVLALAIWYGQKHKKELEYLLVYSIFKPPLIGLELCISGDI